MVLRSYCVLVYHRLCFSLSFLIVIQPTTPTLQACLPFEFLTECALLPSSVSNSPSDSRSPLRCGVY